MKHIFHTELLKNLADILRVDGKNLALAAQVGAATWSRLMAGTSDITVQALIDLCNATRIPIQHFIITYKDGGPVTRELLTREDYVMAEGKYKECRYDLLAVRRRIGVGGGRIHPCDVAKAIGCDKSNIEGRLNLDTKFKMRDFLLMCSTFNIPWRELLHDENRVRRRAQKETDAVQTALRPKMELKNQKTAQGAQKDGAENAKDGADIAVLQAEIAALREEVARLRSRLSDYDRGPLSHKPSAVTYDTAAINHPQAAEQQED